MLAQPTSLNAEARTAPPLLPHDAKLDAGSAKPLDSCVAQVQRNAMDARTPLTPRELLTISAAGKIPYARWAHDTDRAAVTAANAKSEAIVIDSLKAAVTETDKKYISLHCRSIYPAAADKVEEVMAKRQEKAEKELQAAVANADTAEPRPPAGQFPETWDSGATFHWSGEVDKANVKIDGASARVAAERRAMKAVMALDEARLARHSGNLDIGSYRAVSVGWLKQFVKEKQIPREWSTADVVERIIKPETAARRCRYVELLDAAAVGIADLFASHTWGASFVDFVAAVEHVAEESMFVWVDIFAVRQCAARHARLLPASCRSLAAPPLRAGGRAMSPTSTSAPSCATRPRFSSSPSTWRRWRRWSTSMPSRARCRRWPLRSARTFESGASSSWGRRCNLQSRS